MKVRAADEAKGCIARRKSFRWMGCRGMKSKTAEGCYGVFVRHSMSGQFQDKQTILAGVYEPKTGMWYTDESWASILRVNRLDFPDPATNIRWVPPQLILETYKHGYVALVKARIMGQL